MNTCSTKCLLAQSAEAAEYTDCISAVWEDFYNEYRGYDTKQSDGEAPVMLEIWGIQCTPFIAIIPRSTLAWSSSS